MPLFAHLRACSLSLRTSSHTTLPQRSTFPECLSCLIHVGVAILGRLSYNVFIFNGGNHQGRWREVTALAVKEASSNDQEACSVSIEPRRR